MNIYNIRCLEREILCNQFQKSTLVSIHGHITHDQEGVRNHALSYLQSTVARCIETSAASRRRPIIRSDAGADMLVMFLISCLTSVKEKAAAGKLIGMVGQLLKECEAPNGLKSFFLLMHPEENSRWEPCFPSLHQILGSSRPSEWAFTRMDVITSLLGIMSCSTRGPTHFFEFQDTPLFPRLPQEIGSEGYTWTAWVRIEEQPVSKKNLFSFLSHDGTGIQTYISQGLISVRCLPHAVDVVDFSDFLLEAGVWYFICIVHLPMVAALGRTQKNGPLELPLNPEIEDLTATMTLFVNGKPVSSLPIQYPASTPAQQQNRVQATIGGYKGQMGPLHLFGEPLKETDVFALYTLGHGTYAKPAFHSVKGGSVAHFSGPPSGIHVAPSFESIPMGDPITRIIVKHIFSCFPEDAPRGECMSGGWMSPLSDDREECNDRLPSVSRFVLDNREVFAHIGGFNILFFCCASRTAVFDDSYTRVNEHLSQEVLAGVLRLMGELIIGHPTNQKQLFEVGAFSIRSLLLDSLDPCDLSMDLLESCIHLVKCVRREDDSVDRRHLGYFFAILLDIGYWRQAPDDVQIRLCDFAVEFAADPEASWSLASSRMTGIRRMVDNLRVIHVNNFAEGLSFNHQRNLLTEKDQPQRNLSAVGKRTSATGEPGSKSRHRCRPPTDLEITMTTKLLSYILNLSTCTQLQHSGSTADLEGLLLLLEQSVANGPHTQHLAFSLLNLFQELATSMPERMYDFLQAHHSHHAFLRLLASESKVVRLKSLQILRCFVSVLHRKRSSQNQEKAAKKARDYDHYFTDLSTAIGIQLASNPICGEVQQILFDMLIGAALQPVVVAQLPFRSMRSVPTSPARHSVVGHSTRFCHSSFVTLLLELCTNSPREEQDKLLFDLLTLLRSDPGTRCFCSSLFHAQSALAFGWCIFFLESRLL